jgi:hypothetical protein
MTNSDARTLEIPLGLLGGGEYNATIHHDDCDQSDKPETLLTRETKVTSVDTITAALAPAGGHIIHLKPAE